MGICGSKQQGKKYKDIDGKKEEEGKERVVEKKEDNKKIEGTKKEESKVNVPVQNNKSIVEIFTMKNRLYDFPLVEHMDDSKDIPTEYKDKDNRHVKIDESSRCVVKIEGMSDDSIVTCIYKDIDDYNIMVYDGSICMKRLNDAHIENRHICVDRCVSMHQYEEYQIVLSLNGVYILHEYDDIVWHSKLYTYICTSINNNICGYRGVMMIDNNIYILSHEHNIVRIDISYITSHRATCDGYEGNTIYNGNNCVDYYIDRHQRLMYILTIDGYVILHNSSENVYVNDSIGEMTIDRYMNINMIESKYIIVTGWYTSDSTNNVVLMDTSMKVIDTYILSCISIDDIYTRIHIIHTNVMLMYRCMRYIDVYTIHNDHIYYIQSVDVYDMYVYGVHTNDTHIYVYGSHGVHKLSIHI